MEQRGSEFAMRLDLEVFGDNLYGTVEYPTGEGAIQDAKLSWPAILLSHIACSAV